MKIGSVEMVANHVIIARMIKFFVPKEKTTTMSHIVDSAASKGTLRPVNTPRIVLQRGLELHRSIEVQVEVLAPVIILPRW